MITILKLNNGIEVVGNLEKKDTTGVIISKPLQINYRYFMGSTPSVSFVRYIMFAEHSDIHFTNTDILHKVQARAAFANFYNTSVEYYYSELEQTIDEELNSILNIDDKDKDTRMKRILELMPIDDAPVN